MNAVSPEDMGSKNPVFTPVMYWGVTAHRTVEMRAQKISGAGSG